jgi:hypothetical protein
MTSNVLHPETTKMFEITCNWKGETKTALIVVEFCKNGKVLAYSPAGQGFHLTHRNRPLNWATWDLRQHFQETYRKGGPVPSEEEFWNGVLKVGLSCGADRDMLLSITPKRFPTAEEWQLLLSEK